MHDPDVLRALIECVVCVSVPHEAMRRPHVAAKIDPLAVLKMLEPDPRNRLHARHPPDPSPKSPPPPSRPGQRGCACWRTMQH